MTHDELHVLIDLLRIDPALLPALRRMLVDEAGQDDDPAPDVAQAAAAVRAAEARVRAAFVCHRPTEWQVVVGHRDHHRAPGKMTLAVGDRIRLVCTHTYLLIPVEVTRLPETPTGYHRGVIAEMEQTTMRYHVGDGVTFSEDQAVLGGQRQRHVRRTPQPQRSYWQTLP